MNHYINNTIRYLRDLGYDPSFYRRGPKLWRFHVSKADNFWADNESPTMAMREAVALWECSNGRAGR